MCPFQVVDIAIAVRGHPRIVDVVVTLVRAPCEVSVSLHLGSTVDVMPAADEAAKLLRDLTSYTAGLRALPLAERVTHHCRQCGSAWGRTEEGGQMCCQRR